MAFSISVYVLNVGGANNAIEAGGSDSALNNATSLPFFPAPATGFEPESFFMENADPKYFSLEGIEAKGEIYPFFEDFFFIEYMGSLWPPFENEVMELLWYCSSVEKFHSFPRDADPSDFSAEEIGFDCPDWGKRNIGSTRTFYNSAKDPPCVVTIGNSHMGAHKFNFANLAREYDVTFMTLHKSGTDYRFESPPTDWDTIRIEILEKLQPKRVVFQPTDLFRSPYESYELDNLNVTFDALLSGNPEKVVVLGDNPHFSLFGRKPTADVFRKMIVSAIKEGRLTEWAELNQIKPSPDFEQGVRNEAVVAKAIEDNPKYNKVMQFQTIYPAFMDANNTFIQLIGVETEGGNKMLYADASHVSPWGSARLTEYFREHIFKDLNCTK